MISKRKKNDWLYIGSAFAVGSVPGILAWHILNQDKLQHLVTNRPPSDILSELLIYVFVSIAGAIGAQAVYWRCCFAERRFSEALADFNRPLILLVPLLLTPSVFSPKLATAAPALVLCSIAIISGALGALIFQQADRTERCAVSPRSIHLYLLLAFVAYTCSLSVYAVGLHRSFQTDIFDLGIYDNILWQTWNGNFLGCSLLPGGNHVASKFDPILALLVPFYALAPRAETLLILQTILLGSGIFPLYLICRRCLKDRLLAAVLASAYLLYPPLHGVNLYDFHSLALAVPVLLWFCYFLNGRSRIGYWICLAALLLIREDLALLACFAGAYVFLAQRRRVRGLATIAAAVCYLAAVKLLFMPDHHLLMTKPGTAFNYALNFNELIPDPESGVSGLASSVITNPVFTAKVLLTPQKLVFLLHLFGPVLFLPFAAGAGVLLLTYGLLFTLLSSMPVMTSIYFQYPSVIIPFVFALTPVAIRRLAAWRRSHALRIRESCVYAVLCASLLNAYAFGAFRFDSSFYDCRWCTHKRPPVVGTEARRRLESLKRIASLIPASASVSASSRVGPHVSNRAAIYPWPLAQAVSKSRNAPAHQRMAYEAMWGLVSSADYLLLWDGDLRAGNLELLQGLLAGGAYGKVVEEAGITLYERISP